MPAGPVSATGAAGPGVARIGVGFTPFETRADVILRLGLQADESGVDAVEVAEGWTHDSTILLAELALGTSRVRLGTSVISAWGRTPATIALTAAGLQRSSGGRFSLGIGAGSPPPTEGFHGIELDRPVMPLPDALSAVRELPTVAEDLAREVTLMETYDRAGDAIADWLAAGADTVHLVLPPGRPEDELAEVVKIAAASASTTSAD